MQYNRRVVRAVANAVMAMAWWSGRIAAAQTLPPDPCIPENATPEEVDVLNANFLPQQAVGECGTSLRGAFGTACVWYRPGDGTPLRPADLADSSTWNVSELTYSFISTGSDSIDAKITDANMPLDLGHELLRQSLARYVRWSGIRITSEELDDGTLSGLWMSPSRPGPSTGLHFGDIRFTNFPTGSTGGRGFAPDAGGDVQLGSSYFLSDASPSTWRRLRNAAAHEEGHCLGFEHFSPSTRGQMMENFFITDFEGLSHHERRALARNYDDRFFPNITPATAHDFGNLTGSEPQSVIEFDLALNLVPVEGCTLTVDPDVPTQPAIPDPTDTGSPCLTGPNPGNDWFRFHIDPGFTSRITVNPTGGEYYWARAWRTGGPAKRYNGAKAGNIAVYVYHRNADGSLGSLYTTATGLRGTDIVCTIDAADSIGRDYMLLVRETYASPQEEVVVQLYNLSIQVSDTIGPYTAPPRAVAGLPHKRVKRNTPCYFIGDLLSHATEPGTKIALYEWDLDGDGSYDTSCPPTTPPEFDASTPRAIHTYTTAGTVNVRLRVTDTFGRTAEDTMVVEVVP